MTTLTDRLIEQKPDTDRTIEIIEAKIEALKSERARYLAEAEKMLTAYDMTITQLQAIVDEAKNKPAE